MSESLDLQAYRDAPSGIGPLAYQWADKPHRLVYDLIAEVERLRLDPAAGDAPDVDALIEEFEDAAIEYYACDHPVTLGEDCNHERRRNVAHAALLAALADRDAELARRRAERGADALDLDAIRRVAIALQLIVDGKVFPRGRDDWRVRCTGGELFHQTVEGAIATLTLSGIDLRESIDAALATVAALADRDADLARLRADLAQMTRNRDHIAGRAQEYLAEHDAAVADAARVDAVERLRLNVQPYDYEPNWVLYDRVGNLVGSGESWRSAVDLAARAATPAAGGDERPPCERGESCPDCDALADAAVLAARDPTEGVADG